MTVYLPVMTDSPMPSGFRRNLLIAVIMIATLMQVLDTTIANVALPHMQAGLGATPETITWVLTSYIIMSAIATPITGWLEARFGRRQLFTTAIAGFTLSSALCGMATSLEMMVVARALQGIFGAAISPLGQATMLDSSPREKHPQVMMIWGMGVMVGPIVGPVLGGWLTEDYGWRWVFFINLPIGVVATVAMWFLLGPKQLPRRDFDLVGFGLLVIGLASLQLMLDRGVQQDWFNSTEILIEAGLAVAAFWMFVVHNFTTRAPLIPVALFKDRNFVTAVIFITLLMGLMISGAALLAPMLQSLLGYDAMKAGMLIMPRGVGFLLAMPIATFVSKKLDARLVVSTGLMLTAASLWLMTGFDLEMGPRLVVISGFIQGCGMGLVFLPLNILAFSTLAPQLRTEAASVYNLFRNIGGSIAIALMGALIARNVQVSHSELVGNITADKVPYLGAGMLEAMGMNGAMIAQSIDVEINRQALMVAYLDDFWLMMWVVIGTLPLVMLLRNRPQPAGSEPTHLAIE